ncbi:putative late blight resistance protein homolog R1B-16 [Salvia splendens]|uniref:putative late blight resistance protein homolog R1B-16 n=1 Tax=Salvia splendens TaxID=180675 RepID=UPI001C2578B0|nr:putative late blight resistance protein homolog R1B-16 [Salvia splendens]
MAAYASLVSLMQIFDLIEHHPSPPISMDKKQVESLTEIVVFLQEFLEGYKSPFADGDEADPLEMRIADAVYVAEDAIESHIVDQILAAASKDKKDWIGFFNYFRPRKEPKHDGPKITSADLYESLVKVIEDLELIKKKVMEIVADKHQLQRQVSVFAGSSMLRNNSSPSSLSRLNSTAMAGCDDMMLHLMDKVTDGRPGRHVIPIFGMGGIGKTTLARNVYEKPLICRHFDICAWVTISQQFNSKELLCEILSQANKQGKEGFSQTSEDEIGVALHKYLSYRRFFIVLDDMWSVEAWEKLQRYFPDNSNGSRILVTTRLSNLGSKLDRDYGLKMKFLDEESSWNMLCTVVFGGKSCPLELEKIGRKIVESCRGLPLSIVVMGGVLRKLDQTKDCWESIRGSINSLVNLENDKHCLKILKLSYNHLPVYLKPCFLYMGMYEEDRAIRVSEIIKLWVSEGFLKPVRGKILETVAQEYLGELVDRNLILVHMLGKTGSMKYLKTHDLLRDLCLREAENERFYHVVGQHSPPQGTLSQRRVVVQESTSNKEVLDAMRSAPHARSYISDHVRVQRLPNLKLLRILITSLSGELKYSLGKMVNLRHLQVNQSPSSSNLMWCLQTLHVYDGYNGAPVDIWNMPQLRHVSVPINGQLHLPDHPRDSTVIMENLQTLKGVENFKCNEMMVHKILNIKTLRISYNRSQSDYCLYNIERLQKLESFACFNCPSDDLRKLSLVMSRNNSIEDILEKASALPLLQKLKLGGGRLRTGKWETAEGQFLSLKYLSLSRIRQLKCWTMESSHFPCLEQLFLWDMHLKEIPAELGEFPTLKSVVLHACNESAVKSAKRMVEEQEELQGEDQLSFQVEVKLSNQNEELQSLSNLNFQVTAPKRWDSFL